MSSQAVDRLFVIADDLTGAVDTAASSFAEGLRLVVPWRAGERDWTDADQSAPTLLAISTDSRLLDAEEAGHRVRRAVSWANGRGYRLVKKIDSLLRGNVAAEIAAFLDAVDAPSAVFAPALPAQGRITIAGTQLVDGIPVSSSPAGSDPHAPARQSYISALLPPGLRSYPLRINAVREYDLERLVRGAAGGVIVADAAEQADLDRLRSAALAVPDVVLIGSSGLLAESRADLAIDALGPVLVVSASRRSEVADQCHALHHAMLGSTEVVVDPAQVLGGVSDRAAWLASTRGHRVSIVRIDPSAPLAEGAAQRRLDSARLLEEVSAFIRLYHERCVAEGSPQATVVILGGDLAAAVCHVLDVRTLAVTGAACGGGGVCSVVSDGEETALRLVLRSGAFGSSDVLVSALTS